MKNKILNLIVLFLVTFSLCSCGEVVENPPITPPITTPNNPGNDPGNNPVNPDDKKIEYKVSLVYNKKIYIPEDGEVINAYWKDDYSQYSSPIDKTGYATIKLDGDFSVFLDNVPEGYTYNPNIYNASKDNPSIEIELLRIGKLRGTGNGLYNCIKIGSTGTYRTTIEKAKQKIYYEYHPTTNGYYYIESLVNMYDETINPIIDTYIGTIGSKYFRETIDVGGISQKESYTTNFRWVVKLTEEEVGNTFTFAVYADTAIGVYPITIDFQVTYMGEHLSNPTIPSFMEATQDNFITDKYDPNEYTYINSNGGTGNYYSSGLNGSTIIDGSSFKYNENTGFYHYYDKKNDTFGPILCASITTPCAYYEDAFNMIEYHGNSALTVSNGTENYKQFIEIEYAACCNSDGVCYVTPELKDFLQKFSISQRLFMDGNGFVEYTGVYATEEDQWLFACGYYKKN